MVEGGYGGEITPCMQHIIEALEKEDETLQIQDTRRVLFGHKSGYIYSVKTAPLPALHKLGFSRVSAEQRVDQLSRTTGVAEPFVLEHKSYVPDARLYEKAMHIYFADSRIYGRKKEFFAVEQVKLDEFFHMLNGTLQWNEKNAAKWKYAMRTAEHGNGKDPIQVEDLFIPLANANKINPNNGPGIVQGAQAMKLHYVHHAFTELNTFWFAG
jgi:hypothetical protein